VSRSRRFRIVAWICVLACMQCFGDIIVFKNGSRLEVKELKFDEASATYQIKGMTATVPIGYVDREATDAANAELRARQEAEAIAAKPIKAEPVTLQEIPLGNMSSRTLSDREIQEVLKKWAKRREESTLVRHSGAGRNTPPQYIGDGNFEIPFRREGNIMLVQGIINDSIRAEFVFDTGASYVVISADLARRAGAEIDFTIPYQAQTANGMTVFYVGYLTKLEVGNMEVRNLAVMVANNCPMNLLGQSRMSQFRVVMDNKQNRIILERN